MKTQNLRATTFWRFLCFFFGVILLSGSSSLFAQSETNNMITYDTVYNEASGSGKWLVRITRPANMFTANHPDTASRPAIIMMPGQGEANSDTNQLKVNARKLGPHYWLASGQWDGGVQLGNGKHYPILITVVPSYVNPRGPAFYALINYLLNTYHIKRNAVHGTGLSMGAFTWTKSMVYEASAGAETFMKMVTSLTAFQGASNETFAPYNAWSQSWDAFGHWAEKYKGKFFGLEGTNDSRQVWRVSQNMNSHVPGSAYFAFENIGGGAHCCWNDMYSPFRTNWTCEGTLGPNIAVNTQIPNTMGTYQTGSNVFQWMLRQGDTTLVVAGSEPPPAAPPTVNAGSNQTLQLPLSVFNLTGTAQANGGNSIQSVTWTKTAGPAATIVLPGNLGTTVVGFGTGTYTFKLTAVDNQGQSSESSTNVTVMAAELPVVNAGTDQSITLPVNTVQLSGNITGELTSSTWSQVSGPNTASIASPSSLNTAVDGLAEGTYVFRLTGTNSGGSASDDITVTVNPEPVQAPVADAGSDQAITLPANNTQLAGTVQGLATSTTWAQVSGPNTAAIVSTGSLTTDVNNLVEGTYVFSLTATNSGGTHADSVSVTVSAAPVQPPAVNAGADQTITLPASSVLLNGSVQGELSTSQWSQVSGPSSANIVTANELSTEVNGLEAGVYVFELSVTNSGGSNTATVMVTVNPAVTAAPVVTAGSDQVITLPMDSARIDVSVTGEVTSSVWSQLSGPDIAVIGDAASYSTIVNNLKEGVYVFRLIATNDGGADTATVTVTVNPEPQAGQLPVVSAGASQSLTLPEDSTDLTGSVQGELLESMWAQLSGPNTAVIANTASLTTGVSGLIEGVYIFELTATNGAGSASSTVTITVNAAPVAEAPVVTAGANQTVTLPEDSARISATVSGDYDNLTWTQESGPGTAVIVNADSLSTSVTGLAAGTYVFRVSATNTGGTNTATVTVTVNPAPVAAPVVIMGADQEITLPENSVVISAVTTGTAVTTEWVQVSGPGTAAIQNAENASTVVNGLVEGEYIFKLVATNSGGADSATVKVTVNPEPIQAPIVDAGENLFITLPTDSVELNGAVVTGTADEITWSQISGPGTAVIASTGNVVTLVSGLTEGVYVFQLVGTNAGGSDTATVSVTVNAEPVQPPVASAGADQTITLPLNTVQLSGSAQGMVTTTEWIQVSGPGIASIVNADSLITDVNGLEEGVYVFKLVVINSGGQDTATVVVTVNAEVIPAPVVNAGADQSITLPTSTFQLTGSVFGEVMTSTWTQLSGPNTAAIANPSDLVTNASGLVEGVYVFRLAATNQGGNGDDTITLTVNPEPVLPPVVTLGADLVVTLPVNTAQLTGSVSGTVVSSLWSQVSGPNTASFAAPGSVNTGVAGLVEGVYIFRLTATNSGGSGSDDIQVTVNAADAPPVINAGADQLVTLPASSVQLTGTAQGQVTTTAWTQVSGPGTASIASPAELTTVVNGLAEGVYVFRLTGTNSAGSASATVSVTVNPAPVTSQPGSGEPKSLVGQGEYQAYFIDSAKHLWGLGNMSNIGTNGQGTPGVPRRVSVSPIDLKFKAAIGGLHGGAAIDEFGYVWVMGDNDQGQHGQGDLTETLLPRKILVDSAGNPFTNIVAGTAYFVKTSTGGHNGFFAIKADGTLWIWGRTLAGMRGNGTDNIASNSNTRRPVQVVMPGNRKVKQIVAGNFAIALCTDGTVWTWGQTSNANLGYAASGMNYASPHQLTGLTNITQIAGSGSFNYALSSNGILYGWGTNGNQMCDMTYPAGNGLTYTTPKALNNITNKLPLPIKKIVTNTVATHVILEDGSLYGWGLNSEGAVGVGSERIWSNFSPQYAWDFTSTPNELVKTPTAIAPTIKFADVFGSNVYTFYTYAIDVNGQLYCWGRNKASVLAVQIAAPNPVIVGARQSAWDRKWPTPVDPFNQTAAYISTSPDCVAGTSTGSPCSTYPIPTNTRPIAKAGTDQTVATSFAMLNGSASTDNVFISYYEWKQISGPNTAIINLPASKTPTVSNLVTGVYKFQLRVTDNGWLSDSATVQVAVNASIPTNTPPVANAGADKSITLPVNTVQLTGSGTDANGTVVAYQWTKLAGPSQFSILSPAASQTVINNLVQGVYKFELRVTDDEGAFGRDTVTVTVNAAPPPANQLPIASAGPDRVITLPVNSTTLTGSGTDPDGSITAYQWSYISGPTQYSIVSATQAQTSITNMVQGVYRFVLRVTDNQGGTAKDTVTVTVNAAVPANQAPIAAAGPDRVITLPTNTVTLNGTGTDADGSVASFRWSYLSGPAQYTIVSPTQAQTVVNNLVQGSYRFVLLVTDNLGATGRDTISITVNASAPAVNQIPVAYAGGSLSITLPVSTVNANGSQSYDPDGSISTYQWTRISGPAQYTIVSPSQAQTAINNLVQGVYKFELRVTDNQGAIDRDTMTVTVNAAPPANQMPVAYAGANISITLPVNTASLNGSASYDPDGTISSYQWTKVSGPAQYTIVSPTQAQTVINNLVQGTYAFELKVTDDKGAVSRDTMNVTVNAAPVPNQSPVALTGNDVVIALPANSVSANGSGSYDPDGTISSYQWTKVSGPAQYTIVSPTQAQTVINNLVQGIYKFELRVTDNKGAIGRDTITITVNPANQAPVANAGNDVTITLPTSSLTINGSNSYDPDGTITAYQWTKVAGPSQFTIVSPTQKQTSVNNLVQGVYKFELRVTDNQGAIGRDTVTINVNQGVVPNQAPVANAGNNLVITLPVSSATVNGSASYDADGSIASYQWTKISGPASYLIVSPTQAQTVINNLVQGVYAFELKVTDNKGAVAKDTVTITVNQAAPANQLPVANAGSNLVITLPVNSVTANGGSSYDTDGVIASYQWTKISGPAQFTIAAPAQMQSAINNLVQGVYQFELRVTDNLGGIGKDTVTVTVNAQPATPNQLPVAVPGNGQTITIPVNSVQLDGSASYDSDGTIVSYSWTVVSGPSQPAFSSAGAATTQVTELLPGEYHFRLTVVDNKGGQGSEEIVITVLPGESTAKVYPNPATNVINLLIESNTQRNNTDVQIFDAKGNKVHHEQFMRDLPRITRQIDITALSKGVYFLKVQVDINHAKTLQFIKL